MNQKKITNQILAKEQQLNQQLLEKNNHINSLTQEDDKLKERLSTTQAKLETANKQLKFYYQIKNQSDSNSKPPELNSNPPETNPNSKLNTPSTNPSSPANPSTNKQHGKTDMETAGDMTNL